jgi:hypothetical protein
VDVEVGRGVGVDEGGVAQAAAFPCHGALAVGVAVRPAWRCRTRRAIDVTEYSETYQGPVWTGTLVDGTTAAGSTQCVDWTTIGLEEGARGASNYKDGYWTFIGNTGCNAEIRVYCVEQ